MDSRYSGSPSSAIDVADDVEVRRRRRSSTSTTPVGRRPHAAGTPASAATSSSPRGPTSTVTVPVRSSSDSVAPDSDEPAGVDHHHVVAHLLHVVEQVGGHQHRDAERAEPGDEREHLLAAERVEAGGRLVEQHQLGVADERLGQLRALAHAGGEPADRPEPRLVEPDEVEDVRRPLAGGARRQAAELAERRHHVGRGLVEREAVVLGHVAEPGPHADRVVGRRRCRTPRRCPRSGGRGRAAAGTSSSCRRRWRRPARCSPRGTSTVRSSSAVTARVALGEAVEAQQGSAGTIAAVCHRTQPPSDAAQWAVLGTSTTGEMGVADGGVARCGVTGNAPTMTGPARSRRCSE